jgi:hypothetical protein
MVIMHAVTSGENDGYQPYYEAHHHDKGQPLLVVKFF